MRHHLPTQHQIPPRKAIEEPTKHHRAITSIVVEICLIYGQKAHKVHHQQFLAQNRPGEVVLAALTTYIAHRQSHRNSRQEFPRTYLTSVTRLDGKHQMLP